MKFLSLPLLILLTQTGLAQVAFTADQQTLDSSRNHLTVYVIGTEFTGYAQIGWPKQILQYIGQQDSTISTFWYSTRKGRLQSGHERSPKTPVNPTSARDAFLVFDWSKETRKFKAKSVTNAIAWLHLAIQATTDSLDWQREDIALHVFAHSRGAMVALGLGQLYETLGYSIDLMSLLDPHPVAYRKADLGFAWVERTDDPCLQPQKRQTRCLELSVPESILQVRNYYRRDGRYEDMINFHPLGIGQFDGLTLTRGLNLRLNNQLLRDGKRFAVIDGNPHVELLAWYFGVELNRKDFPAYEPDWLTAVRKP